MKYKQIEIPLHPYNYYKNTYSNNINRLDTIKDRSFIVYPIIPTLKLIEVIPNVQEIRIYR